MQDVPETLFYHGRRSLDELVGALQADSAAAALVHKELSLLHLGRFTAMMLSTADAITCDWAPSAE